jgi:glycosyltransferase involved in cell wall biosynthesis
MNQLSKLSILIPVKNEEQNLPACLESVKWADEIFVVDSQSEDKTVEIAKTYTDKIYQFDYQGGWPKKKNWSLENLPFQNEWVLILDADERVTDALRDEIAKAVSNEAIDGYQLRWEFYFLGREMKHCWNHGWMLRLFRHRLGRYENLGMTNEAGWDNEVHENVVVESGRVGKLRHPLIHETRKDLSFWIAKQNQFSDWNATLRVKNSRIYDKYSFKDVFSRDKNVARKAQKKIFLKLPFKAPFIFFYLFFWKRGFLDGKAGFYFCVLRAMHEFITNVKVFDTLRLKGTKTL